MSYNISEAKLLEIYLGEVKNIPLLTDIQEKRLYQRIKKGDDKEARQSLSRHNLPFVVGFAKRYIGRGVPYLDLIQEGNLGLIEAAKTFDPKKDAGFITYAAYHLKKRINRFLRDKVRIVRIPNHVYEVIPIVNRAMVEYCAKNGRPSNVGELVNITGLTRLQVEQSIRASGEFRSLEECADELMNKVCPNVADTSFEEEKLRKLLIELKPRSRKVLDLHYRKRATLDKIGQMLKVTRERVRQIEDDSLKSLRRRLKGELVSTTD